MLLRFFSCLEGITVQVPWIWGLILPGLKVGFHPIVAVPQPQLPWEEKRKTPMKSNYKIRAMIAGLLIPLSMTAFSQENSGEKKHEGGKQAGTQHHGGKVTRPVAGHNSFQPNRVTHAGNVQNPSRPNTAVAHQGQVSHGSNQSATLQQSTVRYANQQVAQTVNRHGGNQQFQPQVTPNNQYNRGNHYGGLWSGANTHNDWNHHGQHYWNNNNYMWYQGGWLIISSGFNPFYVNSGYSNYGSPVSSVQASLANQGYYNGLIDGDAGPGTRNAIASYQNDHNLYVTGHINNDLLQSLQIQ